MFLSFTLRTCHCWGQNATGDPRCNQEQMQSLIMQANVHHLVCLMASHRQTCSSYLWSGFRGSCATISARWLGRTPNMDVKSSICRTGKWLGSRVKGLDDAVVSRLIGREIWVNLLSCRRMASYKKPTNESFLEKEWKKQVLTPIENQSRYLCEQVRDKDATISWPFINPPLTTAALFQRSEQAGGLSFSQSPSDVPVPRLKL